MQPASLLGPLTPTATAAVPARPQPDQPDTAAERLERITNARQEAYRDALNARHDELAAAISSHLGGQHELLVGAAEARADWAASQAQRLSSVADEIGAALCPGAPTVGFAPASLQLSLQADPLVMQLLSAYCPALAELAEPAATTRIEWAVVA